MPIIQDKETAITAAAHNLAVKIKEADTDGTYHDKTEAALAEELRQQIEISAGELEHFFHATMGGDQNPAETMMDAVITAAIGVVAAPYVMVFGINTISAAMTGEEGDPHAFDKYNEIQDYKTLHNYKIAMAVGGSIGGIAALTMQKYVSSASTTESALDQFRKIALEKYHEATKGLNPEVMLEEVVDEQPGMQMHGPAVRLDCRVLNIVPPRNLHKRLERSVGDIEGHDILKGTPHLERLFNGWQVTKDVAGKTIIPAVASFIVGLGISLSLVEKGHEEATPDAGIETLIGVTSIVGYMLYRIAKSKLKQNERSEAAEETVTEEYLESLRDFYQDLERKVKIEHRQQQQQMHQQQVLGQQDELQEVAIDHQPELKDVAYFDIAPAWAEAGCFVKGLDPRVGKDPVPGDLKTNKGKYADVIIPFTSAMLTVQNVHDNAKKYAESRTGRFNDELRKPFCEMCADLCSPVKRCLVSTPQVVGDCASTTLQALRDGCSGLATSVRNCFGYGQQRGPLEEQLLEHA